MDSRIWAHLRRCYAYRNVLEGEWRALRDGAIHSNTRLILLINSGCLRRNLEHIGGVATSALADIPSPKPKPEPSHNGITNDDEQELFPHGNLGV